MHKLRNAPGDSEADLRARLGKIVGKKKLYVLGLGNTDRADDGAGILVAEALKKHFPSYSYSEHDGVEGTVLDISEKEEDAMVIFVDAADLKLGPGSMRIVRKEDIRETEVTTHRVAVALMASILASYGKKSVVVCIQPSSIIFRGKVTAPVTRAVKTLSKVLNDLMSSRDL